MSPGNGSRDPRMRHLQINTVETKASHMDWPLTGAFNGLLVDEVVGMDGRFETPLSLSWVNNAREFEDDIGAKDPA